VLATTLVGGGLLVSPAVQAAGAGSITGRVTNTAGSALPDMEVTAWVLSDGTWVEDDSADTGDDGRYVIPDLADGTYRVEIADPFADYVTQWWDRAPTREAARDVAVAGQPVGGIDGVLGASASALVNLAAPRVTGRLAYGSTLTADPGTWSQPGASFAYTWYVTGRPKLNGTGPTFSLDEPADAGARGVEVVLSVTATVPGLEPVDADALGVRIRPGATPGTGGRKKLAALAAPRVVGSAVVGRRLTLRPGRVSPRATVSVRWLRGTRPVPGARGSTYRLTRADAGVRVRAQVTYRRDGYAVLKVRTASTPAVRGAGRG
jgi:hypothetical protein